MFIKYKRVLILIGIYIVLIIYLLREFYIFIAYNAIIIYLQILA